MKQIITAYKDEIIAIGTLFIALFTLLLVQVNRRQIRITKILERARLNVEPFGIHPWRKGEGFNIVGHIGICNSGKLPALHVRWFVDNQFSHDVNFSPPNAGELDGPIVVPPGATAIQGAPPRSDSDEYAYFYVWGIVEYSDGFSQNRWTRFCHRYNREAFKMISEGGREIAADAGRYHPNGNSTDEERKRAFKWRMT